MFSGNGYRLDHAEKIISAYIATFIENDEVFTISKFRRKVFEYQADE